jgi:hypothetical protein
VSRRRRGEKRSGGSLALSVVLHIVLGAGLLKVLSMPLPLASLFGRTEPTVERIGFIALPEPNSTVTTPGRRGGNGRPESEAPPQPAPEPVAPTTTPSTLPAPAAPTPRPDEGTGPLILGGGPNRGIQPSYSDPRVWVPPGEVAQAPLTKLEKLDSAVAAGVSRVRDSMAVAASGRQPGDWTFTKGGQKYGLDEKGLHLGPLTIPSYLLPAFREQGTAAMNPAAAERARMNLLSMDIQRQAQRALTEDEFRKAVKAIRERKDRERAREKAQPKPVAADPPGGR